MHVYSILWIPDIVMILFVASDAFTQMLTHPLLSRQMWTNGEKTFGTYGWKEVSKKQPTSIRDLVERNTPGGPMDTSMYVGMYLQRSEK